LNKLELNEHNKEGRIRENIEKESSDRKEDNYHITHISCLIGLTFSYL